MRVIVAGAGIVGATTAIELLRDGHEVTILDPAEPGGPQAASFGNAGWLNPASVVPMSMPGLWRRVPGYLLDPSGPLTIRWRALPGLAPWLVRFLAAGATVRRVERTARALATLLRDAPSRHMALAQEIGRPDFVRPDGLLYVYPDRAAFEAEALAWRLRRDNGIRWLELDRQALAVREPALGERYGFGAFVEEAASCTDPGGYVSALVRHAMTNGAALRREAATGFVIEGGRLKGVRTGSGAVAADRAVVAAGLHSSVLARKAGDRVPLANERGYHIQIAGLGTGPCIPTMPSDGKMANTMMAGGLRSAGQVEFAGRDAPPDWRRADILLRHVSLSYPDLTSGLDRSRLQRWFGSRPSTPDGLPVLGPASASPDIVYAFGHGHVGLASGPISGRIASDLVSGGRTPIAVAPFSARRFGHGSGKAP